MTTTMGWIIARPRLASSGLSGGAFFGEVGTGSPQKNATN
jgi:hypothetical protein